MLFDDLNQVPPAPERAVIINLATEVVSAVAIASALRYAGMPVLLVNCTAPGVGRVLMDSLAQEWGFDLVNVQVAPHGTTLDRLFERLYADRILLLDSDAEIRDGSAIPRMRAAFSDDKVYGSGWIHPTDWLNKDQTGANGQMVYRERPWIPCAMFRTSYIRAAKNDGQSFNENFIVGTAVKNLNLPVEFLANGTPAVVQNDTGAAIHGWFADAGFRFDGPTIDQVNGQVNHLHGVTRSVLAGPNGNHTMLNDVENACLQRLNANYPELWDGFVRSIELAQK